MPLQYNMLQAKSPSYIAFLILLIKLYLLAACGIACYLTKYSLGNTSKLYKMKTQFFSGILNVSAVDKSTGKQNKITITNDKGRLTKDDIERMVNDAERFKNEDEAQRDRIQVQPTAICGL